MPQGDARRLLNDCLPGGEGVLLGSQQRRGILGAEIM